MRFTLPFFLSLFAQCCLAQADSIRTSMSITAYRAWAFVHTPSVKYFEGSRPAGLQVERSTMRFDAASFNSTKAFVHTGWAAGYVRFDHPSLGYGLTVSRFIEPQYRVSSKLHLGIRGTLGLAYLSKPHHPVRNPVNRSYSQHVNPYLALGAGAIFRLTPYLRLGLNGSFQHISNGNLKQPNLGINWISTGLGLHYFPQPTPALRYKQRPDRSWKKEKGLVQAGIFLLPYQGYHPKWNAQRKGGAGVFAQLTRKISHTNGLTAGADLYYNRFVYRQGTASPPSPWVSGIHAGHVFLMGKIHFSQQIGYNLYNKIRFLPDFYHRWALDYYLFEKYSIGASLKANSDNADFFDVRLGLKF